ncbi:MAG: hypothetical protein M0Z52_03595 [Actinomycetota bacterium]|nr:hypothetical protein [Actinomycetota bacterium]
MIDNQQSWIGGARLDIFNVTWPFAKLTVSHERLCLKVTFWGAMSFRPDQVLKIEPVGIIPFFGKGIQIHHNLDMQVNPSTVIFWYIAKDAQKIISDLHQWGYGE